MSGTGSMCSAPKVRPAPRPVLLFVHGGGFTGGDKKADDTPFYDNVGTWAVDNGMVGVNMTYRLAHEHQWPAGAEDIAAAIAWVKANIAAEGGDPRRLYLMGHSAGAAHAAAYVARSGFTALPAMASLRNSGRRVLRHRRMRGLPPVQAFITARGPNSTPSAPRCRRSSRSMFPSWSPWASGGARLRTPGAGVDRRPLRARRAASPLRPAPWPQPLFEIMAFGLDYAPDLASPYPRFRQPRRRARIDFLMTFQPGFEKAYNRGNKKGGSELGRTEWRPGANARRHRDQGIAKTFDARPEPVRALENIELFVAEGEFLCIVGPSGCGKTTLLRILGGLESRPKAPSTSR